ncbi:hypothetical protein IGS68_23930 [Skermanella sp. TT6]|uniref:DUF6883 domain-containing protein n=1 Tax=Skermanella cutis TaxID=2775420 RepID=A0ABX7B3U8_9PROT|nr:DUF6883 domain-containing protein [Skermanella sp. TT6]QQP89019.1 hypothetical protein IGS68_23930 [Skermanella sp. TT6]
MNTVPNSHLAVVEESKIKGYLPSENHPTGRNKSAYFRSFGFRADSSSIFSDALLLHLGTSDFISATSSEFGTKYIVEGPLLTPDGRNPQIKVVWFVARSTIIPRLVTAYPARGGQR